MSRMPRPAPVVLPILRDALPGVKVGTWVEDVDLREFPLINIRRVGGVRNPKRPNESPRRVRTLHFF
jgi:hypothetical protein